jgi:cytochrome oxidase Cu insertion factor (SCO1/SenC/PrrC family)
MRKVLQAFVAAGIVAATLLPGVGQSKAPQPPPKIKVGDTAPDFTLLAFDGSKTTAVSLKDFRGKKNVALAFYVFAFTGG